MRGRTTASPSPLATRCTPLERSGDFGVEALDSEPRLVTCVVELDPPLRIASVYVPHGREVGHWHYEYKLAFFDALAEQVAVWIDGASTRRRR